MTLTSTTSDSEFEYFASHLKTKPIPRRNSTGPKYYCTIKDCTSVFNRLDHLDRHEYTHTGIKKHRCTYDECKKAYSILTHLKRHLRSTHERVAAPQKNICCEVEGCEKMFNSNCNMQRHIREVHENPKVYNCCYCEEKFTQKLKMRRHEINKHSGVFPFKCEKCSKGFYQKWHYERHLPICKTYPCPDCIENFDKWSSYLKHCKETMHGRKYYKCEHCPLYYSKPNELQKHVAVKHLDDSEKMIYKCTYKDCSRFYDYERNLQNHIKIVHGGKRFKCTVLGCNRVFSSAQNLSKHMIRFNHNDLKELLDIEEGTAPTPRPPIPKKIRKKRKDAGKSVMSNLTKLSNLAVDRKIDKLLRERDSKTIEDVSAQLTLQNIVDTENEKVVDQMSVESSLTSIKEQGSPKNTQKDDVKGSKNITGKRPCCVNDKDLGKIVTDAKLIRLSQNKDDDKCFQQTEIIDVNDVPIITYETLVSMVME